MTWEAFETEYQDLTQDVLGAHYENYELRLHDWFNHLEGSQEAKAIVRALEEIDTNPFWTRVKVAQGDFIPWSSDRTLRLSQALRMFREFAREKMAFAPVALHYLNSGPRVATAVALLNEQYFEPLARDLLKHIESRQAQPESPKIASSTNLGEPEERRKFRKGLASVGIDQVRYNVALKSIYDPAEAVVAEQWLKDVESGAIITDELVEIVDQLEALKPKYLKGSNITGMFLSTEDDARSISLLTEAVALLDQRFGVGNPHSRQFVQTVNQGSGGFASDGPSLACLTQAVELLRTYVKLSVRKPSVQQSPNATSVALPSQNYVDPSRVAEIEGLPRTKWDFQRLAKLCHEINDAYGSRNYISTAALVRIIMDHVPPLFGCRNFSEVANNHNGGRSFKKSMQHLETSMRHISDAEVHVQLKRSDALPDATQVDVRTDVGALLAEVVRLARMP